MAAEFSRYEGVHEQADCEWIAGWAWDAAQPDRAVDVEIHVDDVLLVRVRADEFRGDLLGAGKGDGRHGFRYAVPFWLQDRTRRSVRVTVAGTTFELTGSGRVIECESPLLGRIRAVRARLQAGIPEGVTAARRLAVFAPYIGGLSETFIRRHMEQLLPDGTVVVTNTLDGPYGGHWTVSCPTLVLDRHPADGREERVRDFLRHHRVQVVLGEYLNESVAWLPVAKRAGLRFVAHAHGYDVSQLLRDPAWRGAYRGYDAADAVVTMSQLTKARLVELGLPPAILHVIPYGVDVPSAPVRRPHRPEVRCVAVGRMVAKKGPILTLDAFRRAVTSLPSLHLDYVGGGPLLPAARQFVRALGLEDRVTLHGSQPSEVVRRMINEADIFVQHSLTDADTGDEEGLPVAILEAMASGLPVLSTSHAGIPEAVVDGVTGYLVEEGDSVTMGDRLVMLARDAEARCRLGEAGWRRASERFTWVSLRTELLRVLGLPAAAPMQ